MTIRNKTTLRLTQAALLAALCYIGFMFLRIDIPISGGGKTAFHFGNTFCVLAALLIGGLYGGLAGAVGMTIADLTSGYAQYAPTTFVLKLCIGLIVGLIAHKMGKLSQDHDRAYITKVTIIAAIGGMLFNVIADPTLGYLYNRFLLKNSVQASSIIAKMTAMSTFVNAVAAVVIGSLLYFALRPALKKAGMFIKL